MKKLYGAIILISAFMISQAINYVLYGTEAGVIFNIVVFIGVIFLTARGVAWITNRVADKVQGR